MTIPTAITDLSTTAASNPPNGSSDTPQEGDDHIRAAYSFIAQNYSEKAPKASPTFTGTPVAPTAAVDTNTTQIATTAFVIGQGYAKLASPTFTGTVTADVLTTTGNTTLGNASTDTLNVGNGGLIKDASGNVGIGASPSASLDVSRTTSDVTGSFRTGSGYSATLQLAGNGGGLGSASFDVIQNATNDAYLINRSNAFMVFATNSLERMRIDASGNTIHVVNTSAPTLDTNQQMVFALTSNTNLRVSVRGTDGVTRVANITLA